LAIKLQQIECKKIAFFTKSDEVRPYKEYIKFENFQFDEMLPISQNGKPTHYQGPVTEEGQEMLFKMLKTDS